MSILSAQNLSVSLSGTPILKKINFSIEKGSWTGILGPNGSGKTTLLRTLAGLISFDGSVYLDGKPLSSWSARSIARRLAFVRQSHSMQFDFRVEELVLLGRSPHKSLLSAYDLTDEKMTREALDLVDLRGFAARRYASLSGGEQQRVFLAQALVQRADVLLLDEPTTFLDVHHQFEFMHHVRTMVENGKTVIGAFHDLEMAARYSDQLVILADGRVAAHGPPHKVLTSKLLADVFRMEAVVDCDPDGSIRIFYARPLGQPSATNQKASRS